jgi:hypothetical protein
MNNYHLLSTYNGRNKKKSTKALIRYYILCFNLNFQIIIQTNAHQLGLITI